MKKYLLPLIATAMLFLAAPSFASNVTVTNPVAVWDNSTGVLQGFGIPGQGQNGYTNVQVRNSAGGVSLPNGTVAIPALNFTSDTDSGLYRIGANNLGIAANGAKVLDIGTTGLGVTGALSSSGDFAVATNKFTTAASSGNTAVAGTLNVTGLATLTAGANSADNLTMTAAAKTLVLKQGANGKTGTVTCNSNTPVTVGNTSFTANSGVLFTLKTVGGTVGALPHLVTATPSTGFDINCTASDTSVYNYHIIESAS